MHREVFEGICSPDNIDSVVSSVPSEPTAADYLILNEEYAPVELDSEERTRRVRELYHLFCRETDYLYKNIDPLSAVFKSKYEAENIRWDAKKHDEEETESFGALRRILSEEGTGGVDMKAVYKHLMDNCDYSDIPLLNQQSVCSETMRQYIMNCILQDESYKQTLFQKLNELSAQEMVPPTDLENVWKLKVLKDLRDHKFIDADNVFLSRRMHAALRELVKKEHVKPDGGWTEGIKRVKDRLASNTKDKQGNICSWLLRDLEAFKTRCFSEFVYEIIWEPFPGTFGKKKEGSIERLTANQLKEVFYSNPQTKPGYEVDIIVRLVEKYEFRKRD